MLQPQNFSDFNIGQIKVPITLNSNSKNDYAILMLINESDEPITDYWSFPWETDIRKSAKSEKRVLVKFEYKKKILGLVSYVVGRHQNSLVIEHLETKQNVQDRLVEPIGKWLLWYCYKVATSFCLGTDAKDMPLIFLFSKPRAFNYYKEKIGMTYQKSIRLGEGEVYAFTDSRIRAEKYIESLITQYGQPIFDET
ncbi:MAG: hypothetical protein NW214_10455 [Pseudanabaenaceae cyanobacterium bins.39]|nr:hypothetical protein [Pseudanabaenaceae cyanobacterium bins.39]